jgi:hypothetical protein
MLTKTTGGEKLGSRETGRRGNAKIPSTTIAVAIMATVMRRFTANFAMGMEVATSLPWTATSIPDGS